MTRAGSNGMWLLILCYLYPSGTLINMLASLSKS